MVNYSIALVFLRKEAGVWKKSIQYVSREEANEKIFEQAEALSKKAG